MTAQLRDSPQRHPLLLAIAVVIVIGRGWRVGEDVEAVLIFEATLK